MTGPDISPLLTSFELGPLTLQNRVAMAPMTRSRAIDNTPSDLMAEYYGQRSTAGLVITEGTSPSADGLGYPRIPGCYSDAQEAGWKKTADALHDGGAHVFMQLMHCGRVAHPKNLPSGDVIAPSCVALEETKMYVDDEGELPIPAPREMTGDEVERIIEDYVAAAKRARSAGIDGVELHGANGYLIEQFLSPHTNRRTDDWGGSIEKRARFLLEIARRTADAIGAKRVGVRLSPYGVFNEMPHYDEIEPTYEYVVSELSKLGLGYVHVLDHSSMGTPPVPFEFKMKLRKLFDGAFVLCGGYDAQRAVEDVSSDACDLVAFGRPYIANPDLVHRMRLHAPLAQPDMSNAYMPGPEGYVDYPHLESSTPSA